MTPPLQASTHLSLKVLRVTLSHIFASWPPRPPTATDYPVSLSDYLLHMSLLSFQPPTHPSSPLQNILVPHSLFPTHTPLCPLSPYLRSPVTPPTPVADCHAIVPSSPLQSPGHSLGFKLHLADLWASVWQMTLKWFRQL